MPSVKVRDVRHTDTYKTDTHTQTARHTDRHTDGPSDSQTDRQTDMLLLLNVSCSVDMLVVFCEDFVVKYFVVLLSLS